LVAAGCGSARHGTSVRETFEAVQEPTSGVGVSPAPANCRLAATYIVREATGTAYLTQSKRIRLRVRAARFEVACRGPLVVELPTAATKVEADGAVRRVHSIMAGAGRSLSARAGATLFLVSWPKGARKLELRFELPGKPQFVRERVAYTASVTCGSSRVLVPVVPLGVGLGFVNAYSVPRSGKPFAFVVPRLAGGATSLAKAAVTVSCP
jgi:hypothetical protein